MSEIIFHGTDIGHQHKTTGVRFLKYLEDNNMNDSNQYLLTQEAIWQGRYYYTDSDNSINWNSIYRENKMIENFICEYDRLNGKSIMGI